MRLAALIASLFLIASPLAAQNAKPATLTQQDRADIARVETYLTGLKAVSAKFLQVNSDGGIARGQFYLSRPGKMRFEYAPPTPILMVADGTLLVYHNRELVETTNLPLASTPIGILVRERVKMDGDVTITGVQRGANLLRVSLRKTSDPDQGELTLIFSDNPFKLEQWEVLDSQRKNTKITLIDMRDEDKLDPQLFVFRDPKFFGPNVKN
ncbi:outer membrane lipoprotein carrier protein LolA [Lacibacterium aquatile]|uniref:Outer membrane lipoprotein carrier protein LolA n=1 Tax=Lacibacterium aquatile TaxID=1168082 RepID=A0ABW5DQZ3_9PROT